MRLRAAALCLTSWSTIVATSLSFEANSVCTEIFNKIGGKNLVFDPLGPNGLKTTSGALQYEDTASSYWDAANDEDRPACIVFPSEAAHVSAAVKALRKKKNVPFATKSGGHQFNKGFSSTNGGVLISLRPHLASTKLASDGQTAHVGPGSRWIEALKALEPHKKAVVGGRIGDVGVGGYVLGGGLSYLSAEYGLASDNVVSFEAVLANGTIVNASKQSNPDLFYALRGGGNIFAIITDLVLNVYDVDQVWGGEVVYTADKISQYNSAVSRFIANNKDSKAAVIPTYDMIGPANVVNVLTLFMFYNGASPPSETFADFNAITALVNDTKTQKYTELVDLPATSATGFRTTCAMNTLPNITPVNMTSFLDWHWHQANRDAFIRSLKSLDVQLFSMALQPISVGLQQASASKGESPLHMNPDGGDKIWIEYDIGWHNTACDDHCPTELRKLIDQAKQYEIKHYGHILPTNYKSGDLKTVAYNPLFMNDAQAGQDVLGSYGASNYQRLKSIHQAVDPEGFFASRQRGFKFEK